ncbi:hypothetical protein CI1B_74300 [Bradyrhizobium ivorense]|uniref:Uncharacterized protein n=2 Tax=Bradyrhizobium ivorense TaxID=2511166 RepID=A0A508TWV7_9BRAD|nr:hypothetical protein CI1B_74300 [Bradyrhizobium ivorense]
MLLAEGHESERLRQIIKECSVIALAGKRSRFLRSRCCWASRGCRAGRGLRRGRSGHNSPEGRAERARKRRNNRGALPAHLPRIEVVVDIDDKTCACCQGELHQIGEDKSERLDMVPAQFRVVVTRRPKYACRACEDDVLQAEAPARLIEGELPTEATVAQVLVSKYADHLPLYRQAQIYARQGIALDRSTLADWVGHAAFHLRPLHERLLTVLRARSKLFADETTVPVLDPGRGPPRPASSGPMPVTGPWGGLDPPGIAAYVYAPDGKAERLFSHLPGFEGVLQVDGYTAYPKLADRGKVELAFCWMHMRRNFYELAAAGPAPIASEALKHIAAFYAIEKEIRGRSPEERCLAWQQKCRPLADAFDASATRQADSHQPEDQARCRHPLRSLALAGADALHR